MMISNEEFCQVAIEIFEKMKGSIPFDLYVQLAEHKYTKIFNRNDKIDMERFKNYEKKGAQSVFIRKKDRREYIGVTERVIKRLTMQENLSHSDASWAIAELSEQTLFEIYEDRIFDEDCLRRAQEIAQAYVKLLKTDIKVLTQFVQLCRNETYMVRHCISTAVIGLLIAYAAENINERMLEIVCLGGLLHDLGMGKLPAEIGDADRKLTAPEWAEVKQHPRLGLEMATGMKDFPTEALQVIEQHHENYNGTGYPKGLKGEEIYYPARIIAIADCFSALTTRRGGRALYPPEEALSLLMTEAGKFDPKLLKSFKELLNPAKKKKAA